MRAYEQIERLLSGLYEEETPSWPYLLQTESGYQIAIFTYLLDEDDPDTGADVVLGYGRECHLDGVRMVSEQKELFETEEKLIFLRDARKITIEERDQMLEQYCAAIDAFLAEPENDTLCRAVGKAFRQMVSGDALALYRQNCPAFLERFCKEDPVGGNEP